MESPSHYPAPAESVELPAVSSVLISPNRVREDCSSVSLDVYPVYEVSQDSTGFILSTAPGEPTSPAVSLPPSDPESLPPAAPVVVDGVLACDLNLLDRGTDLSLLAIPLFPLPAAGTIVGLGSTFYFAGMPVTAGAVDPGGHLCSAGHLGSPFGVQWAAGLPLSYDVLRRYGYRRCRSGV